MTSPLGFIPPAAVRRVAFVIPRVATAAVPFVAKAADAEKDGVPTPADCDDADRVTFRWTPLLSPGAATVRYDLLRRSSAANFVWYGVSSCALVDGSAPVAPEAALPALGQAFFCVARALDPHNSRSLRCGCTGAVPSRGSGARPPATRARLAMPTSSGAANKSAGTTIG